MHVIVLFDYDFLNNFFFYDDLKKDKVVWVIWS